MVAGLAAVKARLRGLHAEESHAADRAAEVILSELAPNRGGRVFDDSIQAETAK